MEFMRPPTDNIYKFAAISGLLLAILSITLPRAKLWELEERVAETEGSLHYLALRLTARVPDLGRHLFASEYILAALDTAGPQSVTRLYEELDALEHRPIEELGPAEQEGYQEFVDELSRLGSERRVLRVLARQLEQLRRASYWGAGAGVVLALIGFVVWYMKVQRYQDQLLRKDAGSVSGS